jgi:predicted transcriptional regulator
VPAEATQKGLQRKKPALRPENSIQEDKIICLECGAEFKQLTNKHLVSHGMDQKGYKKKYGFKMGTKLTSKSLVEIRQKVAEKIGLSEKLKKYHEARRQEKAEAKRPPESDGPGAQRAKRVKSLFAPKKVE